MSDLKEMFNKADQLTQATIILAACARKICESNKPTAVKGDALGIAITYYKHVIRAHACETILKAYKEHDIEFETSIAFLGLESIDDVQRYQNRLNNIMELF